MSLRNDEIFFAICPFISAFQSLQLHYRIQRNNMPDKKYAKPAVKLTEPADSKARNGLQSAQPPDSDARVLLIPARYQEGFSGNPARVGRGEESRDGRNILGLANSAQRGLRLDLLLKIAS